MTAKFKERALATKPNLCLVSTGGTIAGKAAQGGSYKSAELKAEDLLESATIAKHSANWSVRQPYSIGSQDATMNHFLNLRQVVLDALEDESVDGVLITHGTDTMEEAIYFLWATLSPSKRIKPILMTGAMRPSDSPDADGPTNINQSAQVLCSLIQSANATNHSVMGLFMNGFLIEPCRVHKSHTHGVDTFDVDQAVSVKYLLGLEKLVLPDGLTYRHVKAGEFSNLDVFNQSVLVESAKATIEKVQIGFLYCRPDLLSIDNEVDEFIRRMVDSVVVASFGNGNIPERWNHSLLLLVDHGIRVVLATRVKQGGVSESTEPSGLDLLKEKRLPNGMAAFSKGPIELSLPQLFIHERMHILSSWQGQ